MVQYDEQVEDKTENKIDIELDTAEPNTFEFEVEDEPAAPARKKSPQQEYHERHYPYEYETSGYGRERRAAKAVNKHLFTWLFSFGLGLYGADRFMRGQFGLGLLKLFTFGGFGFWYFADLLIAFQKSYSGAFRDSEDLMFDYYGNYLY